MDGFHLLKSVNGTFSMTSTCTVNVGKRLTALPHSLKKKSWPSAFEHGDEGHVLDDFLPSVCKGFVHFDFYLLLVFLIHLQQKRFPFLFKTLLFHPQDRQDSN